jgi:hypothetical protein
MSYAGPAVRGTRAPIKTSTKPDAGLILAAGLTIGLVVGAGAAMLLSPWSGADTRHVLARSGRRLARRGRDAWSDLRYELRRYERRSRNRRDASSL